MLQQSDPEVAKFLLGEAQKSVQQYQQLAENKAKYGTQGHNCHF